MAGIGALLAVLALFSSLSGCGSSSGADGVPEFIYRFADVSNVDAASVRVITLEEAGLEVHDMSEYLPDGAQYLGYSEDMGAIIYLDGLEVRSAVITSGEDAGVMTLDIDPEREELSEISYSDGWLVWVQNEIGDLGEWELRAADAGTGETVRIDGPVNSVDTAPVGITCRDGFVAYSGFTDGDDYGYRAVELYDLENREHRIIAQTPALGPWQFMSPDIGDGFVVYDAANDTDGYSVMLYYIGSGETVELLSGAELTSSAAFGDYIASALTEDGVDRLVIYDGEAGEWLTAVGPETVIDLGESFNQFHTLGVWEDWLGWGNYADYPGVYLYNIADNTALELMAPNDSVRFVSTLRLTSPLAAWREYDSDNNLTAFKFVVLE